MILSLLSSKSSLVSITSPQKTRIEEKVGGQPLTIDMADNQRHGSDWRRINATTSQTPRTIQHFKHEEAENGGDMILGSPFPMSGNI
jgi:hypothetical protein